LKIICVDNYARETIADSLVCENVNDHYAKLIVDLLCANPKRGDSSWYRAVPDDHRLSQGMEDLI